MDEVSAGNLVHVPPDVLVQHLPDKESVFLNLTSEEYFGLDPIGTAMWMALTDTGDIDRARARLLEEFDTDPETLSRDLEALVHLLADRGLLQVRGDPRGPAPPAASG